MINKYLYVFTKVILSRTEGKQGTENRLYCCGAGESRKEKGSGECKGGWRAGEVTLRKEKGWIQKITER